MVHLQFRETIVSLRNPCTRRTICTHTRRRRIKHHIVASHVNSDHSQVVVAHVTMVPHETYCLAAFDAAGADARTIASSVEMVNHHRRGVLCVPKSVELPIVELMETPAKVEKGVIAKFSTVPTTRKFTVRLGKHSALEPPHLDQPSPTLRRRFHLAHLLERMAFIEERSRHQRIISSRCYVVRTRTGGPFSRLVECGPALDKLIRIREIGGSTLGDVWRHRHKFRP